MLVLVILVLRVIIDGVAENQNITMIVIIDLKIVSEILIRIL